MKNKTEQIKGQVSLEEMQSNTPTAPTVKTVSPQTSKTAAQILTNTTEPQDFKRLSEEEIQKLTETQKEEYLAKKEAAFLEKQKEERERVKEKRKELKGIRALMSRADPPPSPPIEDEGEDPEALPTDYSIDRYDSSKKKNDQPRICRKYGIKQKDLKKGIEQARKLFVPKMGTSCDARVLVAIIDLLEFGDI